MSTSNIHDPLNHSAQSPRNAFSIGYSNLFTSPVGMLLPNYVEDVKAGDKVKLSLNSITRTRPVNTAAFMSFDEKTDFWFVPYRLLWSDFPYWRLSQSIPRTTFSNLEAGKVELLPSTTWKSIANFVAGFAPLTLGPDIGNFSLSDVSASFFLRQMDLLGYGIPPYAGLLGHVTDRDFGSLTNSGVTPDNTTLPGFTIKPGETTYLRSVIEQLYLKYDEFVGSPLNYFRLAAYQCIYMAHYRNEEYEKLDPSYYNVDNLFYNSINNGSGVAPSSTSISVSATTSTVGNLAFGVRVSSIDKNTLSLCKLFTPRYKNWRRDVFTSCKPTDLNSVNGLQIPNIGSPGSTGSSFLDPAITYDNAVVNSEADYEKSPDYYKYLSYANAYFPSFAPSSQGDQILASNIRFLLSQDKFARRSLYADKDYKHQMRAIFGVDVSEPDVPRYLGTHSSNVQINELVATSAGQADFDGGSASSVLGELAGKGFQSSDGFVFDESFNEDGIIMGIHYLMPRNNYNSYRINKFNTKLSRFDYYYPDFDGLGYSPVFARELSLVQPVASVNPSIKNYPTNIIGFAPRFYEYKERQNEVHGVFMTDQSESNWTLTNNKEYISAGSDPRLWKILPNVSDPIFSMAYDGSQATDPFMCYFSFDVTRVSNMEVFGLPNT